MSKVIAAIDNSTVARPVLAMAQAVARALDAAVEVVHIIEDFEEGPTPATGVPLRTLSGDPVDLLTKVAAENDVVVVILGARSAPSGPRPAGHVAMALAGRTAKPVVLVPPDADPPDQLHKVLVAMEGSPGKARALQRSIEISVRARLQIVVVHVHDEDSIPSFSDQLQHETETYTQEFFARHQIDSPQTRLVLRVGVPATEVLNAIESTQAELVAVGWPRSDDRSRGGVAREIVDRSPVPILLVAMT